MPGPLDYATLNAVHRLLWERQSGPRLGATEIYRLLRAEGFRPKRPDNVRRYLEQLRRIGVLGEADYVPRMEPLYPAYLFLDLPSAQEGALDTALRAHDARVRRLAIAVKPQAHPEQLELLVAPDTHVAFIPEPTYNRVVRTRGTLQQLEELRTGCATFTAFPRLVRALSERVLKAAVVTP